MPGGWQGAAAVDSLSLRKVAVAVQAPSAESAAPSQFVQWMYLFANRTNLFTVTVHTVGPIHRRPV